MDEFARKWGNAVRSIECCVLCGAYGVQVAHRNEGKGMGKKAADYLVAALCPACHHDIDNGPNLTLAERRAKMDRAIVLTLAYLVEHNLIGVVDGQGLVLLPSSVRRVRKALGRNHGKESGAMARSGGGDRAGQGSAVRAGVSGRDQKAVGSDRKAQGGSKSEGTILTKALKFSLQRTLPGLNKYSRMNMFAKQNMRRDIAREVAAELWASCGVTARQIGPIVRCRVHIYRYSTGTLDGDNKSGVPKFLLDVLQPQSARHPDGLGLILNDSESCIVEQMVIQMPGKDLTEIEILPE